MVVQQREFLLDENGGYFPQNTILVFFQQMSCLYLFITMVTVKNILSFENVIQPAIYKDITKEFGGEK